MLQLSVVLYLVATLLIGVWASRYIKNAADFINAGRSLPVGINAFAFFALWFGSETIFGATSEFVEGGFRSVIEDPFGGVLCLVLFATFFVRPLYRMNILTIGDLFRSRFGVSVELVSAVFMLITFFGYIAAQLVALGILLQMLMGLSLSSGIVISALVVCVYTLIGGMWAVSITDFIQSLVIIAGLVWVSWVIGTKAGGFQKVIELAPVDFFKLSPRNYSAMELMHYAAAWMALGLGSLPSQDIFQRMNAGKSEITAVRSTYLGAVIYLMMAMFPLFIALAGKQLYPELMEGDRQQFLPHLILVHTSLPLQILFFGALLSAIFSTCSGAILAPASILSENIVKPLKGGKFTDGQFLWILRGAVLFMTCLATLLALSRSNVYELVGEASVLGMVCLLVPFIVAIWHKKVSSLGALLSMILGFLAYILAHYGLETEFPASIIGLLVSAGAYFITKSMVGK